MTYVTAALTRLSSLSIVTIKARGKRITQAIDVSQMIVKRMNEVGFTINDVRILSEPLISRDGKKRIVSTIEIDVKNTSIN
jgi:DNA-binding protein